MYSARSKSDLTAVGMKITEIMTSKTVIAVRAKPYGRVIIILLILILLLGWWQLGSSRRGSLGVKSIGTVLSPEGDLSYVDADGRSHKVRLTPLLKMAKNNNGSPATTSYVLQGTNLIATTSSDTSRPTTASVDLSSLLSPANSVTSGTSSNTNSDTATKPRLTLSGANLTIAGGNTVNLNSLLYPVSAIELTGSNGVVVNHSATNGSADISIATADGSRSGLLSAVDWTTFNAKESGLTFAGNGLFSRTGNTVSSLSCTAAQTLVYSGVNWICSNVAASGVSSISGSGAITSSGGTSPTISLTTSSSLSQTGNVLDLSASGATAGTYGSSTSSRQRYSGRYD